MAAAEVHVKWEDLDVSHVGKAVHIVTAPTQHWGVITRMFRDASHTTIFIGANEQKDFRSDMGSASLYFLEEGKRGWSGPAAP